MTGHSTAQHAAKDSSTWCVRAGRRAGKAQHASLCSAAPHPQFIPSTAEQRTHKLKDTPACTAQGTDTKRAGQRPESPTAAPPQHAPSCLTQTGTKISSKSRSLYCTSMHSPLSCSSRWWCSANLSTALQDTRAAQQAHETKTGQQEKQGRSARECVADQGGCCRKLCQRLGNKHKAASRAGFCCVVIRVGALCCGHPSSAACGQVRTWQTTPA